ncbi:MAG TPA: FAD-dependent oxidoreductase [Actinophytocola sp.]|uniref:NAD(P)/FAD-dependent oxidoreductase n=1 Tax=Actinophytocola sp. TaxID=1872138 RepID=UPI002DB9B4D5|nr:FAD-dependent oxidoreductase [Actinophytocola sp.]HEU5475256.1 FAD-dependent oxidoreductase [Actinophytocola sp.]
MVEVVIAGGGVAGLATALALAGDGHRVVVLERGDPPPAGPPGPAGERWDRPAVPQARHAHTLTSLGVGVLREHAPGLLAELHRAGAHPLDLTRAMPPDPRGRAPGDADLVALACRRSTFDVVLHRHVRAHPGVEIRQHTRVLGLATDDGGVTGVCTDSGGVVPADLVIDATGRRALGRRWLRDLGIDLPADRSGPTSTRAHTRFYRRTGGAAPLNRGNAAGVLADHYAGVLHPGDGDTFSVSLGVLPGDRALRLAEPGAFDATARITPFVADWMHRAEPVSGVRVISTPPNTLSALATTPPPVPGLLPVGDAACVTDPLFGRGLSLALAHAFRLAELLRAHPGCGAGLGRAAARAAAALFDPWYRQAQAESLDRIGRWRAAVAGEPVRTGRISPLRAASAVAGRDPVVWRAVTRVLMGLRTPEETFADRDLADRVAAAGPPPPVPGLPSRAGLLAATAREGGARVLAAGDRC